MRRDPLAHFDERTGVTMVKIHLPWEKRGWNLYAIAARRRRAIRPSRRLGDHRPTLGRVGDGGRAEVVLGNVELAPTRSRRTATGRASASTSRPAWWGPRRLRRGRAADVGGHPALARHPGQTDLLKRYERHDPIGFIPQVVLGATYDVQYSDEDAVTFGAEYFYDDSGYGGPEIYPALLAVSSLSPFPGFSVAGAPVTNPYAGQPNPFTSFYLGRHYGGAFVSLPRPGRWNDTTFTLSVLGNLSDESFVARLDHSVLLLTYLRLETYAAGHFGSREGEFRLGFAIPSGTIGTVPFPGFATAPIVFEAGIALRVSL